LRPTALGDGFAVIESLVDVGEFRDTHDATCRRLMAEVRPARRSSSATRR
jgi:hypothetical protein